MENSRIAQLRREIQIVDNSESTDPATEAMWQFYLSRGRGRGLDAVISMLQARYPSDPLFKPTRRLRPNGKAEYAFHAIMDAGTLASAQECPASISADHLKLFNQNTA